MKNANRAVTTALASLVALSAFSAQSVHAEDKKDMEKCYGVVKAGKNDCKTATSACAGHSTADSQTDAFIALPKGTCERITGGSLEAPKS